jgi:hypothetical protein
MQINFMTQAFYCHFLFHYSKYEGDNRTREMIMNARNYNYYRDSIRPSQSLHKDTTASLKLPSAVNICIMQGPILINLS